MKKKMMQAVYCGDAQVWCDTCDSSQIDMGPNNRVCDDCGDTTFPATKEQLMGEGCDPRDIAEVEIEIEVPNV